MIPKIVIDIIDSMWPVLSLCSVVLITLRLAYLYIHKQRLILYKELIGFSFVIYILLLFELVTTTDYYAYGNNFVPFKEIFRYQFTSPLFIKNVIGNVALFIPFGYCASYYCKINKFYIIIFINTIISLTIETIQLHIERSFDIDDILLNIVGGYIGYIIYRISQKMMRKYPDKFKNSLLLNLVFLGLMFILVLFILRLYEVI